MTRVSHFPRSAPSEISALRQTSPTTVPSPVCFSTKAICASDNSMLSWSLRHPTPCGNNWNFPEARLRAKRKRSFQCNAGCYCDRCNEGNQFLVPPDSVCTGAVYLLAPIGATVGAVEGKDHALDILRRWLKGVQDCGRCDRVPKEPVRRDIGTDATSTNTLCLFYSDPRCSTSFANRHRRIRPQVEP